MNLILDGAYCCADWLVRRVQPIQIGAVELLVYRDGTLHLRPRSNRPAPPGFTLEGTYRAGLTYRDACADLDAARKRALSAPDRIVEAAYWPSLTAQQKPRQARQAARA